MRSTAAARRSEVARRQQRLYGHGMMVGVAEVLRAVGEHALLDLGREVHVLRRIVWQARKVLGQEVLQAEQLQDGKAARTRRGRGEDLELAPTHPQRLPPDGTVTGEVGCRDQAATATHLLVDQPCRLAPIEAIRAVRLDPPEDRRQFSLAEHLARAHPAEMLGKACTRKPRRFLVHAGLELGRHDESDLRKLDRGLYQLVPREPSEAAVRFPQSGDGPRDADGPVADEARPARDLAVRAEVHVAGRRDRGHLPVVEEMGLSIHPCQQETTAADVAGLGIGDRQREGDRDGGVDGVATPTQHLLGHVSGELVWNGEGSCSRPVRNSCGLVAAHPAASDTRRNAARTA